MRTDRDETPDQKPDISKDETLALNLADMLPMHKDERVDALTRQVRQQAAHINDLNEILGEMFRRFPHSRRCPEFEYPCGFVSNCSCWKRNARLLLWGKVPMEDHETELEPKPSHTKLGLGRNT